MFVLHLECSFDMALQMVEPVVVELVVDKEVVVVRFVEPEVDKQVVVERFVDPKFGDKALQVDKGMPL